MRFSYNQLKEEYDSAVVDNKEQFMFDGHTVLTSYAKHLLEFMRGQLDEKNLDTRQKIFELRERKEEDERKIGDRADAKEFPSST